MAYMQKRGCVAVDNIYDYKKLCNDFAKLLKNYPFLTASIIGKSVKGKNIYIMRLGRGEIKVFYNASHHGLEWITSMLVMRFAFDYAKHYVSGTRFYGFDIRRLYEKASIYIAPMVNPDGIELSKSKPGWQANARGVDLNHNYNAGWEEYKALAAKAGITKKRSTRYPGKRWESEPESAAIANFTRQTDFEYVIALHSQGEEIFWQYGKTNPPKSERIGKLISQISGYRLSKASGLSSYSGYKDWFIKEFNRPGYTIEVGKGKNPLPVSQFDDIYGKIAKVLLLPEAATA